MSQTRFLVSQHLPNDVVNIVMDYFQSSERTWKAIAQQGEYESLMSCTEPNLGLYGACLGGHIEIVHLMISMNANHWNWGLFGACLYGHIPIVDLMLSKQPNHLNGGLAAACLGKYMQIAQWMIANGADYCSHCENKEHFFLIEK